MNEQKKEYQVINLFFEYGRCINGCEYAVASDWSEAELRVAFADELQVYSPFIYLTAEQGEAIIESNRNEAKHRMRSLRNPHRFSYCDGESELFHPEIAAQDVLEMVLEKARVNEINEALDLLNEIQRRRVWKHIVEGKSEREIALEEGAAKSCVHRSIESGLKNLKKFLS